MASMPEIKVAVESLIHDEITKALQQVFDSYGIRIETISANWYVARAASGLVEAQVTEVRIASIKEQP